MKLALITDTHWGVRNDSIQFIDNTKKFLDNIFFPYIKENNIDTVIHLGDIVDRRKFININTANRLRQDFLDPLFQNNLKLHLIIGNHDTYYKNTNEVNSARELVRPETYTNITLYDGAATEVEFDGLPILFIPWICDANREESLNAIKESKSSVAMGHLEISGFEMYRGSIVSHGFDRNLFDRFSYVFSGHYHHRSTDGSIYYLGSHAEFTWSDYDDPRGFHVFDTETNKIDFIENPYKMFKKIWYDDTVEGFNIDEFVYKEYTETMVKVIVQNKSNPYWFDKFIERLEDSNPLQLQIIEDHLNFEVEDEEDLINEAESTLDIFKKFIDGYENDKINKKSLKNKITELYNEAISLE